MEHEEYLIWEVEEGTLSTDEAGAIIESLADQVASETDSEIEYREVRPLTGPETVVVSFVVGVASKVAAQAIYDALSDTPETESVRVSEGLSITHTGSGDINLSVSDAEIEAADDRTDEERREE
ncbi:hypothetical protein [Halobaculum roseum]|uniref:Asp23/Gls24 family envelope stress response protein n=1 Tax=Halobaculum roseum TaxID=2175149 RepID=A0ABD5MKG4_9EURY|nr:hypothetical protein [Halobaculum roseum]QZY01893.1 hypothetical protein K6T36_11275 [Halobaculum roseum]